jgi:acetyltransferase-like isoleucine patch superfamily enzyme
LSDFYQHPNAVIEDGASVGGGTRVWAFAHIASGAIVGRECNICDHTFIEGGAKVGDRVTVKCGVYLWKGLIVDDDVHIGPGATFTNDLRPRSRNSLYELLPTKLGKHCSIGANATVLPGLMIGRSAMVGAGAVVTRSVPDFALVLGSPARVAGWVCRCGEKLNFAAKNECRCQCGRSYSQVSDQSICEIQT